MVRNRGHAGPFSEHRGWRLRLACLAGTDCHRRSRVASVVPPLNDRAARTTQAYAIIPACQPTFFNVLTGSALQDPLAKVGVAHIGNDEREAERQSRDSTLGARCRAPTRVAGHLVYES